MINRELADHFIPTSWSIFRFACGRSCILFPQARVDHLDASRLHAESPPAFADSPREAGVGQQIGEAVRQRELRRRRAPAYPQLGRVRGYHRPECSRTVGPGSSPLSGPSASPLRWQGNATTRALEQDVLHLGETDVVSSPPRRSVLGGAKSVTGPTIRQRACGRR